MEPTKVCTKCGTEKPLSDFYFRKDSQKYRTECIACVQKRNKAWIEQNPERYAAGQQSYRKENRARQAVLGRRWYEANKEHAKALSDAWKSKNLEKHRACQYAWKKKPGPTQERLRLANNLRSRVKAALSGICKSANTMTLLGCSIEFLREYLEKQFLPGMTWENYGYRGWHVDHIKPCALFDLSDPDQQKICFNYTNLQPLWASDNRKKWKKYA